MQVNIASFTSKAGHKSFQSSSENSRLNMHFFWNPLNDFFLTESILKQAEKQFYYISLEPWNIWQYLDLKHEFLQFRIIRSKNKVKH